ncbi:hypothetical protein COS78_01420 [Candidatus Shapirobacteria bacterium CG06_land_8_20_14_3_00_40_12]|uniref:SET domain-containing protein n=2 Tax=Candidatus Shapironibacteriota TaxID=1752721 RepID=A0A2M7TS46_9BACT|nr:MAG: hypothetical protein COS78_01420 [Candidatus Shapirobacteria bacterium CG06_land_8_20_14_3_00_40_12]PIZ58361.1 MAG: hypothetical protein COY20_03680 [Candidatus Shapirobacteria bacterium CG_4_10_14_0_2_um_filter_40_12]
MTNSYQKTWITPKVKIKESLIGGNGMFAILPIDKGEKVVIWGGEYMGKPGADIAIKQGKLVMRWDENLFSIEDRGDSPGYFINHSCESNLWMKDAFTLTARKRIGIGEEITADYCLWEADENFVSKWTCNCNSPDCRKLITGKDWHNQDIQKKYFGHFSPLINKKIAKSR